MDEEHLTPELRDAIIDRFEAWDLVDFLMLKTEQIVDAFEDVIVDNLEDIMDYVNIRVKDEDYE
ncbi:hypothetical protein KGP36_03180 [Patescibacteria group bacterium]|nr:hypothetical protein [Patescibacteria group bacterium]